jgi:hypothetical protein
MADFPYSRCMEYMQKIGLFDPANKRPIAFKYFKRKEDGTYIYQDKRPLIDWEAIAKALAVKDPEYSVYSQYYPVAFQMYVTAVEKTDVSLPVPQDEITLDRTFGTDQVEVIKYIVQVNMKRLREEMEQKFLALESQYQQLSAQHHALCDDLVRLLTAPLPPTSGASDINNSSYTTDNDLCEMDESQF